MDTIMDLCFLCTKDYNCVVADKKIVSQVEYLLPEITIIKLGIPLRICPDCDGALCAFSKFKQSSVESSRLLEAHIKGAQGPPLHTGSPFVVDDSETSGAEPEKIEEIFIQEEYVEETPLDTNRAFLNPIDLVETIIAEPHNQLHKDRVSQNIQLHTDTNADDIEEVLIKEEQIEDPSQDNSFYDIWKEEYDVSSSMNIDTDRQPEHYTEDESATLNTSEEVWSESSVDSAEEILVKTDNQEQSTKEIQKNKEHQCNICKKTFIYKFELNKHVNQHNGNRNFPCLQCKKKFFNNCQLKRHIELHCEKTKLKTNAKIQIKDSFSCSLCNKKFKNKTLLDRHIKLHCKICEKSFTQKDDLTLHMSTHSGVKDFKFNIGTKEKLVSRMRIIYKIKTFKCKVCDKTYKLKENLTKHMKTHSEVKDFQCEICNKIFNHKNNLNIHMKIHSEVKPFQCEICGKSFRRTHALTRHTNSHSELRDFQCKICNKTFKDRKGLNKHLKIHSGIKDFQCEICEKSFMLKCQLTSHMKIHSEIKDFHCVICEKSFRHKCSLINHMKYHSVME